VVYIKKRTTITCTFASRTVTVVLRAICRRDVTKIKKRGAETTCTKFLHTKGFRNKLNGLQALCPLLPCLGSSLISGGIRSDTSVLLSLLLSALLLFGWDLVFSLLDVYVTCALFLYFSCFKKREKNLMLPFSSCHSWNIYIKRKCHVIFLSSSFLLSFLHSHSHVSPRRGWMLSGCIWEISCLMVFRVGGFPSGLCPLAG